MAEPDGIKSRLEEMLRHCHGEIEDLAKRRWRCHLCNGPLRLHPEERNMAEVEEMLRLSPRPGLGPRGVTFLLDRTPGLRALWREMRLVESMLDMLQLHQPAVLRKDKSNGAQICQYLNYAATKLGKLFYSTGEVAQLLDRQVDTVRGWCRNRRMQVETTPGRGGLEEYRVHVSELIRYLNDGLLPEDNPYRYTGGP